MTWSILELVLFLGVLLDELVVPSVGTDSDCLFVSVHLSWGCWEDTCIFGRSVGSGAVTSSGYSFVTGWFDLLVDVQMFATLISPSPAMTSLTTTYLHSHEVHCISSCTNAQAPGFRVC